MHEITRSYLSQLGRLGGRQSRRRLTPEQARAMVAVREARRAYKQFHTQCFWSFDPHYVITQKDVVWVAQRLQEFGGQQGWVLGAKLCR